MLAPCDNSRYRGRPVRRPRDHACMSSRPLRLATDEVPVIPPGCWPTRDDVVENAELRVLSQGTGDHLPYELRLRGRAARSARAALVAGGGVNRGGTDDG
jgi:hypothetical protein